MEKTKQNKMGIEPLEKLIWKLGLPMIVSMVLQAMYNVVDSIFVANMSGDGALANEALTIAFPIQILIIAIGVGTGVGLNALLSKSLGQMNREKVNRIAGNGIFLSIIIFAVFLVFGLFFAESFIGLFTSDPSVLEMGTSYLKICTCFSFGSIGYTIYERFLQATGKTIFSTISQISGAVTNIALDYVFIFPLGMGVKGAALATVIGQFISLFVAMAFHYLANKEIGGNPRYIRPERDIIKGIYSIGISAALMQGLLSVMMAGMNAILASANADSTILVGSFGIYYKIQQIALFSAFGLSNTIITVLSFNYGMKSKERSNDCIKYGIINTLITTLFITLLFELIAHPLSQLFALSGGSATALVDICARATRIASIGFVFMGFSVAVQGVLQALGYAGKPLILATLRLIVFVFPVAYFFTLSPNVLYNIWWTFPIAELLTAIFAYAFLMQAKSKKINLMQDTYVHTNRNLIITIAREHGTNGKQIGKLLAERLGLNYYDKKLSMMEAKHRGLDKKYADTIAQEDTSLLYLSLDASRESLIAQNEIINELANEKSFVIVGRASDYVLRDYSNVIKIFLYASKEYRINNVMKLYHDNRKEAERQIIRSDKARAQYYESVTNQKWGDKNNYTLCLDCSLGNEAIVNILEELIKGYQKANHLEIQTKSSANFIKQLNRSAS